MWFVYALLTTLAWGCADLFYKKGADETDRYSHLKTSVMVGLVMGIHAVIMLIVLFVNGTTYNFLNLLIYLPVSLMYILSMTVGYFGLRYLELSVSSPIQNASGVVSAIIMILVLRELPAPIEYVAIAFITVGVVILGILEKQKEDEFEAINDKKYKIGFIAFFMPIAYCIIDSIGTALDGIYLDDFTKTPLVGVTEENFEDVANISYELTFLIVAIALFVFIKFIKKEKFGLFEQRDRAGAAIFETAGQLSYVYAMSGNGVVAAPMIASYSIVSIILSRIFLKEKLSKKQYAAVISVMLGIVILGVVEGLLEMENLPAWLASLIGAGE